MARPEPALDASSLRNQSGRAYRSPVKRSRQRDSMENFTPLSATVGGVLIGIAATILWAVNGRTAGISNIVGGMYPMRRGDELWRIVFLIALPVGGWLGYVIGPVVFAEVPATLPEIELPTVWLLVAGLLVGVGTRVGRGCTSGHGVCGLARFSIRSVAAVGTFMATAGITVFFSRHVFS